MRNKVSWRANWGLMICLALTGAACQSAGNAHGQKESGSAAHGHASPGSDGAKSSSDRRIPAHFSAPPDLNSLPPILSADQFTGRAREAYQAASMIPQTIAQLPCFCYCDESVGHKSLHSCYESDHSSHCTICQDEAILAVQFKKRGLSDAQIRERIIAQYAAQ